MKSKKKILISGAYGTGNTGDEVILDCILGLLKDYDVTVLSQEINYTKLNFKDIRVVEQTPNLSFVRVLKDLLKFRLKEIKKRVRFLYELYRADIFWLGGGGLLAEMLPQVLQYYLDQLVFAKLLGCKVVTFAVGVGPLKTENGKNRLRLVMNQYVDFISVRDEDSKNLLLHAGVEKNINVTPDPAFNFKVKNIAKSDYVAINFYSTFDDPNVWKGQQYRHKKLKDTIIDATRYIVEKYNYQVVFLPFGTKSDLQFSNIVKSEFEKKYENHRGKIDVFEGQNYHEIVRKLVSAKWSITMRFHAGLISLVHGTPSVCIDQQFKTERVLSKLKLLELLISLPDGHHKVGNNDIDQEELYFKIDNMNDNIEIISRKLKDDIAKEGKDVLAFYRLILSNL